MLPKETGRAWRRLQLVAAIFLSLFRDASAEGLSPRPLTGPVVLAPNVIKGTVRFSNANPEVLAILQTEGMDGIATAAQSPAGYAASTNYLATVNNLSGSYQLSAEASGGVGSVTYLVAASAWVNRGALSGASGLGSGQYGFQSQTVTLEPVEVQPDGVTLNFTETVGVVRIRYGTDSSCTTPVPILGAEIWTARGFTYLNQVYKPD
jgi:hypothetical protein